MAISRFLQAFLCAGFALAGVARAEDGVLAGPLYSHFDLTLSPGTRTEAAGPLFYSQDIESEHRIAFPPLFSSTRDRDLEMIETDFAYPVVTYRRYGGEYRVQLLQLISWAGGRTQKEDTNRRFTLFPFYFQQRNPADPQKNYTALVPFYGHLNNRLFRDDIKFVMFPIYSQTRKKDIVTDNYLYPIFDRRRGDGLAGWQAWPVVGKEIKLITYRTNQLDEVEVVGGHEKFFSAWPFYFHDWTGLGTTNPVESKSVVPFYNRTRSPGRDSTSYGYPFGYSITDNREDKYHERDFLWPLFEFARGEGKNTTRVFPFYSSAKTTNKESSWIVWPIYKVNRLHADPLERSRTRIFFFLYSDTVERNTETGEHMRHIEEWPLFSSRRELDGSRRLQILSIVEPVLPNNTNIKRDFAPIYTLWLSEKNAKTGATSQSLLWNLYRRDKSPTTKNISLLFGLFRYESHPAGKTWRVCYVPVAKKSANNATAKP